MGCFSADPPPAPNYGQITRDTLQAQVDLAPQQFAVESHFQPLYSSLELNNLNTLLNGAPGGPQNYSSSVKAGQTGWYDASGNFISPGTLQTPNPDGPRGDLHWPIGSNMPSYGQTSYIPGTAPAPGAVWRNSGDMFDVTKTRDTTAQPGLFALTRQQNTAQRTADINDVATLGPQATQAMLAANPYNATLLAKLNAQANEGLDAGSLLTPEQQRAMQQSSRSAFAARGMGGSNGGIADELLKQFNLGQELLRQRQQFAQSVLGNNQAVIGDPFSQILARNSGALPAAFQGQQQSGPALFNPSAGIGLAQSNYATQSQFAAANNPLATIGGILGGVGKMAGGAGSAFTAFCWVAREVYGADNPQWVWFRTWLICDAPLWLVRLYRRHGEAFAGWLQGRTWLKRILRKLMDAAIVRVQQPLTN